MKAAVLLSLFLLMSCSSSLDDYQGSTPTFDLRQYFTGKVTAWGIVQDYSKQLTRRFCVDIIGTWQGQQGQLHETFYFADGQQQVRVWQLTIHPDGLITGTAGDVVGQASGLQSGAAFNWQYNLQLAVGDNSYEFAIDDWMYMLDQQRVMNRSYMKKFGINLAEISIFFDKSQPLQPCPAAG